MRLLYLLLTIAVCWFASYVARAQELTAPDQVPAGQGLSIPSDGKGKATFYLLGPNHVSKRTVNLGDKIQIAPEERRAAGRYVAIISSGERKQTKVFFVSPGKPAALNFLARPSRVATAQPDVISGVVFVFDEYKNLVLAPAAVKFSLALERTTPTERTVPAKDGIAWIRMNSGRSQGAAQFVASLSGATASVRRVVQQVAADACALHMKAHSDGKAILVETDPIKDCTGNPVPDGTIVTFTQLDDRGRSTVDARVKRDVARAEFPLSNNATISVASGVVLGNEVHVGAASASARP